MATNIEKEYNKLIIKYKNLPNFQVLDKTFDITLSIAEKEIPARFVLRVMANSITNYIYHFIEYLHNMLYPNSASLILMEESKIYSDEEKKKIEEILKKMTFLTRRNLELAIIRDEKEDSEYIIKAYEEWKSMRKQLLFIIEKAKNHWKT